MEHDEFANYLEVLREQRKTPREREIEKELAKIGAKHRAALLAECEPLQAELDRIEMAKGPLPIMHDEKVFEYVGPRVSP